MAQKNKKKTNKNREYSIVTYFFFFIFLALIGYFIYFQTAKSEQFINSPYNSLQDLFSQYVTRGDIVSADGHMLAETNTSVDGTETRNYPAGRMFAHAVGFSTNGKAGLENQCNFNLLRSHEFFVKQIFDDISGNKSKGDTVVTTLNYDLQSVAYQSLGSYDGAVIVMEPQTGKILAMVSKPDYDPNTIAADWESVNSEGNSSLYNRATQGQYAPGSTFKIFTALEYYREHPDDYMDYQYDCTGKIVADNSTINCYKGEVHGAVNFEQSFAESCNTSFSNIGLQIDNDSFDALCNSMLFNTSLPIAFESSKSKFSLSSEDSAAMTMETSIGQGKTMVSPLHMLLVTSAICNDGVLMKPYLVDHTENVDGVVVSSNSQSQYSALLSQNESDMLESLMSAAVSYGTCSKLSGQSYSAYGKTGTAEVSDTTDQTNAWFVGYAKKDGYNDIAIAVIVENSGAGSTYAVPIAKNVFDKYFN